MAGDEVKMSPTAYLAIHNPWTMASGNSDEMRVTARQLDEIKEGVINAYQIKTGLLREEISQMMDEETYINAVRAVELGFADKVLYEKEDVPSEFSVSFSQKMAANQVYAKIRGEPFKEEKKETVKTSAGKYKEILKKLREKKQ
jgi:ATP-dependent Clp protease protease subunit